MNFAELEEEEKKISSAVVNLCLCSDGDELKTHSFFFFFLKCTPQEIISLIWANCSRWFLEEMLMTGVFNASSLAASAGTILCRGVRCAQ